MPQHIGDRTNVGIVTRHGWLRKVRKKKLVAKDVAQDYRKENAYHTLTMTFVDDIFSLWQIGVLVGSVCDHYVAAKYKKGGTKKPPRIPAIGHNTHG